MLEKIKKRLLNDEIEHPELDEIMDFLSKRGFMDRYRDALKTQLKSKDSKEVKKRLFTCNKVLRVEEFPQWLI